MAKAPAKKAPAKKVSKEAGGKDKELMQVIRDCVERPWCAHTMEITDKEITYQRPPESVQFMALYTEQVNPDAVCTEVKVTL